MRAGWMRPSCSSFSSVIRAISRRTPSKPDRITAFGVSSMMKSTPVRCSSARMLRPSRPMMRPFMSSAESCTTETVVSAAWPAARRCITTERMLRTRRSASRLVSSSTWRRIRARSWRIWSSTSLSSWLRACEAGIPATRSSSRTWCSRAASSSAALSASSRSRWPSSAIRLSTASSRARSRSSSRSRSARRSALLPSSVVAMAPAGLPTSAVGAARRARDGRRARRGAAFARAGAAAKPGARRVSSDAAATRPTARTTAAIRISMTLFSPTGRDPRIAAPLSSSRLRERQARPCPGHARQASIKATVEVAASVGG